jgi:hypothetical protein
VDNVRLLNLNALGHVQSEVEHPVALFGATTQQSDKARDACRSLTGAALQARQNWLFLRLCWRIAFTIFGHENLPINGVPGPANGRDYYPGLARTSSLLTNPNCYFAVTWLGSRLSERHLLNRVALSLGLRPPRPTIGNSRSRLAINRQFTD